MHEPCFEGNELEYVTDCIKTGYVAGGEYVGKFERMLSDYTGAYAVPTVNGTSALHIALKVAGVGPGDDVVVPALTFVATANAVSYLGAMPHFADINGCLSLSGLKLEKYLQKHKIKAVVVVHTFGHPAKMDLLVDICKHYRVILIEDAAQSLGSFYKGAHTGTFGLVSAVSFNGNKIVTSGGGGAVLTGDRSLAEKARHLINVAKVEGYYHDAVGYNYRMPNINAALGCAQMEQIETFIEKKRKLADKYHREYGDEFLLEPLYTRSNYWLNTVITERSVPEGKRAWTPLHRLPMYRNHPKMDLWMCESLDGKIINLPSSVKEAEKCR